MREEPDLKERLLTKEYQQNEEYDQMLLVMFESPEMEIRRRNF